MCRKCQNFLYDYLQVGPRKELELAKQIRVKSLQRILPEFSEWCLRMNTRIGISNFDRALMTASRIAQRGRKAYEYEYLIHTATFNFLKHEHPWIMNEVDYMKLLLIEAGVVKGRERNKALTHAQDYLSFVLPRTILCLRDLHEDHVNPKGLYTDLGKLFRPKYEDFEGSSYDEDDDYQKEILEEDDIDDLYT
jgi:hypothetical protein